MREFKTPLSDGWGITNDGRQLILSDGSSRLTWVNPATMAAVRSVEVKDGNQTIKLLNELEYINGEVWANIWQTECIARICPTTGRVQGWVLMHGLKAALQARGLPQNSGMDVLNGIAYDVAGKRLFVTGKLWPRVFVVKLTKVPAVKVATGKKMRQQRQSCYVS
jgi:glutamine cyclotransferase